MKKSNFKRTEFNDLSLTDKALIVAEHGIYLESCEYYDYWVHLYVINFNFVEIYYNIATRQIDRIQIPSYYELDKHVDKILLQKV